VLADDHLAEIALFEARGSTQALASRRLAVLDDLKDATRERMQETLRAFLDHRGNAAAMATDLHLHPQTVRYRLRQLRNLFGKALDDPEARFELELALRATAGSGADSRVGKDHVT
jgi:DNA-binding PucR family transcriptional regulator